MATYLSTRTTPPPHIAPTSVRDEEIDLRTLFTTVGDHKKAILFGTLMFFLASVLYVVLATPKYEANATVQVERRTPTFPGLASNSAAQSTAAESPAATEIQLLTSRSVLSEALDNLDLDVQIKPAHFPIFGDYIARTFASDRPNDVNEPWFGLSRYGWGGESVSIARLDVPAELVDQPLKLVAGDANRYTLYDPDGDVLVNGIVGQPAQAAGVNVLVRGMAANPGMRFEVTRLNTLAILSQLRKDISASEQGRDSGVIALSYQSEDPILARSVLEQISRAYVHQNVARNSAEAAKRLQFVKRQLPIVRKELDKAQAALTDYQTRTQTLDVTVQNQSLLNQTVSIDSSISQLRIQQADLASRFTPNHPTYKALLAQIGQFEAQKGQLRGADRRAAGNAAEPVPPDARRRSHQPDLRQPARPGAAARHRARQRDRQCARDRPGRRRLRKPRMAEADPGDRRRHAARRADHVRLRAAAPDDASRRGRSGRHRTARPAGLCVDPVQRARPRAHGQSAALRQRAASDCSRSTRRPTWRWKRCAACARACTSRASRRRTTC